MNRTPWRASAAAPRSTVVGMSCSLRSQNTAKPSSCSRSNAVRARPRRRARSRPSRSPNHGATRARHRERGVEIADVERAARAGPGPPVAPPMHRSPSSSSSQISAAAPTRSATRSTSRSAHQAASSSWIRFTARGSWKLIVPTPTARRAGQQHLDRVGAGRDPAGADDRRPGQGARHLVHHPERDRLDRRAGVAAGDAAEQRAPVLGVDAEPEQRVHQREPVGAGVDRGARDVDDLERVRRQLREERQAEPDRAHRGDDRARSPRASGRTSATRPRRSDSSR